MKTESPRKTGVRTGNADPDIDKTPTIRYNRPWMHTCKVCKSCLLFIKKILRRKKMKKIIALLLALV
ncbi:MAG: hypothetical protein IJ259_03960, partial [Oscillospiraceae bacterium]|nr:hypothetical protein [Oscillospiraceae bacterium]